MSKKKSDYPRNYKHPRTEQERVAANRAQEVSLKFDGYRLVEAEKTEESAEGGEQAEAPTSDATPETPAPAPKPASKPGPTTTPKAQEGK